MRARTCVGSSEPFESFTERYVPQQLNIGIQVPLSGSWTQLNWPDLCSVGDVHRLQHDSMLDELEFGKMQVSHHTSSASPASTSGFALDQRRISMSPSLASNVTSASVPRPCTSLSRSMRMNTAVSMSGESIILMLPAVSLRFWSCCGNEARKDER